MQDFEVVGLRVVELDIMKHSIAEVDSLGIETSTIFL